MLADLLFFQDIDAKYGVIWVRGRNAHLGSPQEAMRMYIQAFATDKDKLPTKVHDLFAIPDYKALIKPHTDPAFSRAFKEEWTKLQWIFQAVSPSERFPLGVKTTYKAFSQDEVYNVFSKDNIQFTETYKVQIE